MTRSLCFLVLLLVAENVGAETPEDFVGKSLIEAAPASGYLAEVEVSLEGISRRGRIIVTHDGVVHLEHLDEQTRRWVNAVIRRSPSALNGWDDRALSAGRVQFVSKRLGQIDVLAEIHTPNASLKISQHQLLSAR